MNRTIRILVAIATAAVALGSSSSLAAPRSNDGAPRPDARAVMAALAKLRGADLWPGYDTGVTPVAIYDGDSTFLFRHPQPPPEFRPLAGEPGVLACAGRYAEVTANTSARIGGVRTATLMPADSSATLEGRTAVLVHEMFHVFQREHHPKWSANEAALFVYPFDDSLQLFRRRLESDALLRALKASGAAADCWARAALAARRERFAALDPNLVAYERGTELNEGLATYVEDRVRRRADAEIMPPDEFPAEGVRSRAYRTGVAWGRLLDRFAPDWRRRLEQNDSIPLDSLLVLALRKPARKTCGATAAEQAAMRDRAARDVAALRDRRLERRRAFDVADGWRVVIESGAPLFPQGFDPLNVLRLSAADVLHSRYVKVGNAAGGVEVIGAASVTEGIGAHPLFNGIRRLTVAGLAAEPSLADSAGTLTIGGAGLTGTLKGARVERGDHLVTIRLP